MVNGFSQRTLAFHDHHDMPFCPSCGAETLDTEPAQRSSRIVELLTESSSLPEFAEPNEHRDLLQQSQQLQTEIEQLETTLETLRVQFQSALARKATVARNLDDIKHILRPIRRVPVEVLQKIFIFTRDANLSQSDAESPYFSINSFSSRSVTAPWNISQICQRWRKAALGCPQLWAYIGLQVHINHPPTGGFWNLLGIQLSRAHMGPLFVSISSINSLPPMLVLFLMPSAFRWKHVKLLVLEQSLEEELVPLRPLLSSMEALEINLSSLSPVSIFKNSLQLRELSTEALSSLSHFSCADNAFSIRRLVLSGTRLAEGDTFGQILSSYTRVEEMFVRWFIPTVPENLPAPIKMPHLRHLELYRVPDGTLEQTIKHMTAPSLQSLSVTIHQSRFDGQDLDDFLKRSRCSLHYLDLDIQGISEPVLQPYHMIKLLEQCRCWKMRGRGLPKR